MELGGLELGTSSKLGTPLELLESSEDQKNTAGVPLLKTSSHPNPVHQQLAARLTPPQTARMDHLSPPPRCGPWWKAWHGWSARPCPVSRSEK